MLIVNMPQKVLYFYSREYDFVLQDNGKTLKVFSHYPNKGINVRKADLSQVTRLEIIEGSRIPFYGVSNLSVSIQNDDIVLSFHIDEEIKKEVFENMKFLQ